MIQCPTIERHFSLFYDGINPIIRAIYVIVAVMLIISGISESACQFLLKGLSLVAELCLSQTGSLTDEAQRLLRGIGTDPRRIIRALKLSPDARSYVCCPKCFACYLKTSDDSYPDRCIYKKSPSSTECGRQLRKVRTGKNTEFSVPVRPFLYHEINEWLGEMLCRPGMEDMLDRDVSPSKDGVMHDIWDAPELHDLRGADGKPFVRGDGSEGRYVFSFCMDGFNPFQLKQAGKKASVVAMYMICLNLPPEERYKLENMFLVGIIPGPHEPKKEEINHLLSPLVDDLLDSYHHGVWYSRTHNYKHGRYARSVLAIVVCD
jgi:Transposase family tnp2